MEGRLKLHDGRTLAWREYGPSDGRPVLRFPGTPGSRCSRYPYEEAYAALGARVIVADRPAFGASTRLPGRGMAAVAGDAGELVDHLGLDRVYLIGGSGGGPHALAFAALHPERVEAATVVVGAAPITEDEADGLIEINRRGWFAAQEAWDSVARILTPAREELLRDPLGAFRELMRVAPPADQAVMDDPAWQRMMVEDVTEALRPGVEGWVDETMAILNAWDFEPSAVGCSVTWWHGEHDANSPISAVRRLVSSLDRADLRVWSDAGHLHWYHQHDEILAELLSR